MPDWKSENLDPAGVLAPRRHGEAHPPPYQSGVENEAAISYLLSNPIPCPYSDIKLIVVQRKIFMMVSSTEQSIRVSRIKNLMTGKGSSSQGATMQEGNKTNSSITSSSRASTLVNRAVSIDS